MAQTIVWSVVDSKDAVLKSAYPDSNFNETLLNIGTAASGKGNPVLWARGIIDITIPTGITITTNSKIEFYQQGRSRAGSKDATLARITQAAWTETGTTWNKYDGTNNWTTAGGDVSTPTVAFTFPDADGVWITMTGTETQTYLQDAVTSRSGVCRMRLKFAVESDEDREFSIASSEYSPVSLIPKITVDYTGATTQTKTLTGVANIAAVGEAI